MLPINLKKLPITRQSDLSLVLGGLTAIIGFFQMLMGLGSALFYNGDGGTGFY